MNPTVPLGVFILCGVGTDRRITAIEAMIGDSDLGEFFGEPAKVAHSMMALADVGIDRVQVSPFDDASFALLSPHLF